MSVVLHHMTFNKRVGTATTIILMVLLMLAFLFIAANSSLFTPQKASAQVISPAPTQQTSCIVLNSNMGYGRYDYSSGGAVSQLQTFLNGQGYFNSFYFGTGRYGAITLRSVAQFQAAHGVPATGFVGPLTRALIQQISCGTNPTPVEGVSLYGAYPNAGAVGTTVTLSGLGLTSDNTILMDGMVAAKNVSIMYTFACIPGITCDNNRQVLSFTVPNYLSPNCAANMACAQYVRLVTPGQYKVTVVNANGTSNAITFTVIDTTNTNQQLSITGLDAPASLPLGTPGTWTVHALSNGQGTLHYSVVWGDEAGYTSSGIMAPQNTSTQSSATFTHAYARSGNYTPMFTVTDDFGHSVTTSNTVVVTPLY